MRIGVVPVENFEPNTCRTGWGAMSRSSSMGMVPASIQRVSALDSESSRSRCPLECRAPARPRNAARAPGPPPPARARDPAPKKAATATTPLTTAATAAARSTTGRARPAASLPTSIATSRVAAMSIPNRVAAPPMKANWVARVTTPRAEGPSPREITMLAPREATTNTTSPAMFWPVPARIARWSPNRSWGRTDRSAPRNPFGASPLTTASTPWGVGARSIRPGSFEVAQPPEVFFDLARLGIVERRRRIRSLRPFLDPGHLGPVGHLGPEHRGQRRPRVADRGRRPHRGQDRGSQVHELERPIEPRPVHRGTRGGQHPVHPVVPREPVGRLHRGPGVRQAVERRGLQDEVGGQVRVGALEHLLPPPDPAHRPPAGLRIDEGRHALGDLVADPLEVRRIDDPVRLPPGEVDRDALAGRSDARVGLRL